MADEDEVSARTGVHDGARGLDLNVVAFEDTHAADKTDDHGVRGEAELRAHAEGGGGLELDTVSKLRPVVDGLHAAGRHAASDESAADVIGDCDESVVAARE